MAGAAPADLPIYNLMEGTDPTPHKKVGDVMGVQGTEGSGIRLSNLSPQPFGVRISSFQHSMMLASAVAHAIFTRTLAVEGAGRAGEKSATNNTGALSRRSPTLASIVSIGDSIRLVEQPANRRDLPKHAGVRVLQEATNAMFSSNVNQSGSGLHESVT